MKPSFDFNRSQKIGVASLGLIILVLLITLNVPYHGVVDDYFDVDTTTIEYYPLNSSNQFERGHGNDKSSVIYETFNPNAYQKKDWEAIGFSPKQSNAILNFKERIGGFKSKNDIQKIYVISSTKYTEIEPYLKFVDKNKVKVEAKKEQLIPHLVELNDATPEMLNEINGIGEVLAGRIVKFRDKLGGFYIVNQLQEVYGLSVENYNRMSPFLKVDIEKIKKVNAQIATFNQLKSHPYVSWEMAKLIVTERNEDSISTLDFLKEEQIVGEADFERIKFYLKLK